MRTTGETACRIIALSCAGAVLSICITVLGLWQLAPANLVGLDPGHPVMSPDSAIALGLAAAFLLFFSYSSREDQRPSTSQAVGLLLFTFGAFDIAEYLTRLRFWVNHFYFDFLFHHVPSAPLVAQTPCPVSGASLVFLGLAFLFWKRSFRISQIFLFLDLTIASIVLLGHVYDVPFFYRLSSEAPLDGTSALAASTLTLLCVGMLFSRARESVVRFALAGGPAGAVVARFGLGGLAVLTIFGPLTVLRVPISYAVHLPNIGTALTAAFFSGVAGLVWSSVRALDRIERERSKAITELELSRERLLWAQRLARLGYWQWDMAADQVYASDNLIRILGLPLRDTPDSYATFFQRVHPDDVGRLKKAIVDSIAGHSYFSADFRVVHPEGETLHLHAQALVELDEGGHPSRMRGTCHDVTDAKRAEEDLRQSRQLLQTVIDSLPVGVWILDRDGNAQSSNPAGTKIWGQSAISLETLAESDAWCEHSGRKIELEQWAAFRTLRKGETSIGELVRVQFSEKCTRFLLSSAIPMRDPSGAITGAVMVHEDVSAQREAEVGARYAEQRAKTLLAKANEAVRVREDVLSIVSHDLKNPLTSASLGVQLLLRQLKNRPGDEGIFRTARNVQRSMENMAHLIQGILDVGKIQSGTFSVEPTPLD
ncbi:MAG: PAS domain-containing sensor histidine kinase, partial [Bdellovibrionota bacterium]